MKKIIIAIFVLTFATISYGQDSPEAQADALFAKGEYLGGMNILTKALNNPDPLERAKALEAYAKFYENLVGNAGYTLNLYEDILRVNLPADHPIKASAQKEIGRLKSIQSKYAAEDNIIKRLQAPEILSPEKNEQQAEQLISIIDKKPDYYRIHEIYYLLGRNYVAMEKYYQAYGLLKKSIELKPAINFYMPVNVYKDMAYVKWVRLVVNSATRSITGVLLVVTIIAFYLSRPWRWLKLRHITILLAVALLWLAVFGISYKLLSNPKLSDQLIADISAAMPAFVDSGAGGPNWQVVQNLFLYGLVGISGLFVFTIGTSGIKSRPAALLINAAFGLLLFATLTTIFYMQNCDQKSAFASESQDGIGYYVNGGNYFLSFGMEPYVLTNPKAYPNLAVSNLTDVHMIEWVKKHCPFPSPANQPGH
jgi:tetratricopeptide (TPR) repeat protein